MWLPSPAFTLRFTAELNSEAMPSILLPLDHIHMDKLTIMYQNQTHLPLKGGIQIQGKPLLNILRYDSFGYNFNSALRQ